MSRTAQTHLSATVVRGGIGSRPGRCISQRPLTDRETVRLKHRMKETNLTRATAGRLRELALSVPEGCLLGTEKDLVVRFGVSRPTFRQAVHIVEAERIVESVRGLNGGLFSRRPNLDGVITAAATYLRSRETTLGDVLLAANAALVEAVGGAAACQDPGLRQQLAELIASLSARETAEQPLGQFYQDEMTSTSLICEMSANPALDLAVRLFFRVGMDAVKVMFENRENLMQDRRTARLLILRAIAASDRARAVELTRRNADLAQENLRSLLLQPMQSIPLIADDGEGVLTSP
jgi:DNA-binding FadR family transcriptional regulator